MKSTAILLIFLNFGIVAYSSDLFNSIELKGGITNYFIYRKNYPELNFINYPNLGGSICISKYISTNKSLNIGLNYAEKDYYVKSKFEPTRYNNYFSDIEYFINYLNIPITIEHLLFETKPYTIGAITGLVINHRLNYRIQYNYLYDDPKIYNGDDYYRYNTFGSARIGAYLLRKITSKISCKVESIIDFKFLMLDDPKRSDPRDLPNDRLSVVLNIAFAFSKRE